jgi:hypothetical protein
MDIHELIRELAQFGTVETGHGPRHPTAPSPAFASEIAAFLDEYPFVKRDRGYVEFLECYAGLLFWRAQDCLSLSIYGFDPDVSLHLAEGEGDIITREGFLTFADAAVPIEEGRFSSEDPQGAAFGFDATERRRWGVYRCSSNQPYEWYCETFEEWLGLLVSLRGRWL